MHSRFRVTNWSDRLGLEVGAPGLLRVPGGEKKGGEEELRLYVEPKLQCRKLLPSVEEEARGALGAWLAVEPHTLTLAATALTPELLASEEKQRAREAARLAAAQAVVEEEQQVQEAEEKEVEQEQQLVNGDRKKKTLGQGQGLQGRSKSARPGRTEEQKQRRREREGAVARAKGLARPQAAPPRAPALSSTLPLLPTTPIPKGELPPQSIRSPPLLPPGPPNPLLSSLTPLPPKQYTRPPAPQQSHLISIKVPMAGPDGTQTLQTINVPRSVLAGASDRPILLTVTPKNGVNKGQKQIVVLTKNSATGNTTAALTPQPPQGPPVPALPVAPQALPNAPQALPTAPQALSTAPQAPSTAPLVHQEAPKAVHLSPRPGGATPGIPQLVVRQQATPLRPPTLPQVPAPRPPSLPPASPRPPAAQLASPRPPGAPQVVVRAPAPPAQQVARAAAPRPPRAPQVLRGQLMQTPQGQMLVQGDRRILLGPNSVVQGGKLVLTAAQMATLTGAPAPQAPQPPASSQAPQPSVIRQAVAAPQPTLTAPKPAPVAPQSAPVAPQASAALRLGVAAASTGGAAPPASAGGESQEALQTRILAALHNRGLVSQSNGKFYYVGGGANQGKQVTLPQGAALKLAQQQRVVVQGVQGQRQTVVQQQGQGQQQGMGQQQGLVQQQGVQQGVVQQQRVVAQQQQGVVAGGQQQQQSTNQVVIPGANLSMDSIAASPHMLKIASSLLLGSPSNLSPSQPSPLSSSTNGAPSPVKMPTIPNSLLPSTILPTSPLPFLPSSPLPPSLTPSSPLPPSALAPAPASPLKLEGGKQTFYYKDPALPHSWYIRIDRTQVGEHRYQVETTYFSPDGALLRNQQEVASYLGGRLQVRDKSHLPPVAVSRLPWKDDLIETNKLFVPNLENLANIVNAGANPRSPLKRAGEGFGGSGEEKRPCPEPPLTPFTL